jgi:hypothetical protein
MNSNLLNTTPIHCHSKTPPSKNSSSNYKSSNNNNIFNEFYSNEFNSPPNKKYCFTSPVKRKKKVIFSPSIKKPNQNELKNRITINPNHQVKRSLNFSKTTEWKNNHFQPQSQSQQSQSQQSQQEVKSNILSKKCNNETPNLTCKNNKNNLSPILNYDGLESNKTIHIYKDDNNEDTILQIVTNTHIIHINQAKLRVAKCPDYLYNLNN